MSTRLSLSMAFVVVLGVLAMISGPIAPRDLAAAMSAEQPLEMLERPELLAPNPVLDKNVAILSLSSHRSSMTNTVATLYSQPDPASKVVYTMMPGTPVSVAGFDASNSFAASTDTRTRTRLYGWMAIHQLVSEETVMQVVGVATVYSQPSPASARIDELGPYQLVSLLGVSSDGNWYAMANNGQHQDMVGWIQSNTVQQLDMRLEK